MVYSKLTRGIVYKVIDERDETDVRSAGCRVGVVLRRDVVLVDAVPPLCSPPTVGQLSSVR